MSSGCDGGKPINQAIKDNFPETQGLVGIEQKTASGTAYDRIDTVISLSSHETGKGIIPNQGKARPAVEGEAGAPGGPTDISGIVFLAPKPRQRHQPRPL
jgi:hypothetical protein